MSDQRQRMVDYHLSRLKDKRPEVRIKAIEELVLLDAVEAMDALKEVFEQDADVDVRKAAQRAGRELFTRSTASE